MEGYEYEEYCEKILSEAGWVVMQTKRTGDQGADLIANIKYLKVCIQCKRQQNPVGVKAVQEAIAGKIYHDCTHAAVVSNSKFTKSAKDLANKANVILISDAELGHLKIKF